MKINRRPHHHQHYPYRDYSWPPSTPPPPPSSSISNNSLQQSNQNVTNTLSSQSIGHKIDHIRKLEEEQLSQSSLKNNEIRKSMSSSPSQSQSLDGRSEKEWPPLYHYKDSGHHPSFNFSPEQTIIRRTYSLPEDEITNQGFFEPIRLFWESISSPTSSLDRKVQRQPTNFNSILNGKKWKSFENFNEPITIDDEDGDDKVLQLLVTEQKEQLKMVGIEWYVNWRLQGSFKY